MLVMKKLGLGLAALLALGVATDALVANTDPGKPAFGDWGIDLSARDTAVKPGDDFFAYSNGGWDKRTEIAPDRTGAGIDFLLSDQAERQVRAIVEDLAKDSAASGKIGQQVSDMYASWMDEAALEAKGAAPLKSFLGRIGGVKDREGLLTLFASQGFASPVALYIAANPADPKRYVTYASQGGLGLPNRDYYLLPGAKYDGYRAGYRAFLIKIQTLAGITDPARRADGVIALETALATAQWTPERSRDTKLTYNPMNRKQIAALAPQFNWVPTLRTAGLGDVPTVIVGETTAIQAAGKMLDTVPLATWRDYLACHFISDHASYLSHAFDQANFDYFSKQLRDVPTQRERWKRGIGLLDGTLGEAVGQVYVARHYPPANDALMAELIANLRGGLKERINANSWMDAATRKEALTKLASFDPRTGHPAKYKDYNALSVARDDLLGNILRSEAFEWNLQLARLPKPVDRSLWEMTPQTVNAYYDPLLNQITFPAAILQPPYFDPKADPAVNYGSIGATIGHEIGHGFDDQGRLYDATGKLRDWWTPLSARKFTARSDVLVKQFSTYAPVPGTRINGKLTLGENLGDLGGLEMAYAAWRRYVAEHGEPPVIDGYTGDQRFFLAYGYSWQSKYREGSVREQLLSDPHSPAAYRVNGIVRNVDAWYKAFNIKPGDKLYLAPAQRVHIW
jgi:putative endopeptidase